MPWLFSWARHLRVICREQTASLTAPDAFDIGGTIRWQAAALGVPDDFAQAFHDFVLGFVFGPLALCQGLESFTDAGWLINGNLLADRQMHRQMQEWVGLALLDRVVGFQRGQDLIFAMFAEGFTKEAAHIVLAWVEHCGC